MHFSNEMQAAQYDQATQTAMTNQIYIAMASYIVYPQNLLWEMKENAMMRT